MDIIFSDKTDYDEQVANVITDYVDLVKELKNLAERKRASINNEINCILNKHANLNFLVHIIIHDRRRIMLNILF
ncbi:MAG TPA: hypothetical protein VJ697_12460 [Nitrososphaeraceae archaeon]|nr:hypothetical protein [Nitrososphaeraceae archaeon]